MQENENEAAAMTLLSYEVVLALLDGYQTHKPERRDACKAGLVALGPAAALMVWEIATNLPLPPKERKALLALEKELDNSPDPPADRDAIVLDVLCVEAACEVTGESRAERALNVIINRPEHEIADHCIARAISCVQDRGLCIQWLSHALRLDTPSDASVKALKTLAKHANFYIQHHATELLASVGQARPELSNRR